MEFWGKYSIRSKIVLQDQLLGQVSYLNYLGCEISKGNEREIDKKLGRFQMLCGTIHTRTYIYITLKNKTRRDTRLEFYKTVTVPALMYGSVIWVPTKKVQTTIQSTEIIYHGKPKAVQN
jgi:hypothetical protein